MGVDHHIRGSHPESGAPLRRDGVRLRSRGDRAVHDLQPLHRLRRQAAQARVPGRYRWRDQHHGLHRQVDSGGFGLGDGPRGAGAFQKWSQGASYGEGADHSQPDPQGDRVPAHLSEGHRPGISHPGPVGGHPERGRSPADTSGHPDRQRPDGGAVRLRRTLGGPAPRRRSSTHRDPQAPPGPGQHHPDSRARRGDNAGRRPHHRPGARGRRARRVAGGGGHRRPDHRLRGVPDRPLPGRVQGDTPSRKAQGQQRQVIGDKGGQAEQLEEYRRGVPPGGLRVRYRSLGERQEHPDQRDSVQEAGPVLLQGQG